MGNLFLGRRRSARSRLRGRWLSSKPRSPDNNDNGLAHPDKVSPQVDEVIGIMHKNVENVLERDRKLGDLEERADALQDGCAQFEKQVPFQS